MGRIGFPPAEPSPPLSARTTLVLHLPLSAPSNMLKICSMVPLCSHAADVEHTVQSIHVCCLLQCIHILLHMHPHVSLGQHADMGQGVDSMCTVAPLVFKAVQLGPFVCSTHQRYTHTNADGIFTIPVQPATRRSYLTHRPSTTDPDVPESFAPLCLP
ncbi:hypothetical protein B0H10DRAFT_2235760 [Mycena sp. CBHHK59/15]|nr:hypothetical protein B0H10DRAFT_2235760 [Mycena sp. CBHHK59/15]